SLEPINSDGSSIDGDNPTNTANNATIKIALTGYDTASVTHKITANANTPSARCPATGSDSGFGNIIIINSTTKAAISDIALCFFTTLSSNVVKFINIQYQIISINYYKLLSLNKKHVDTLYYDFLATFDFESSFYAFTFYENYIKYYNLFHLTVRSNSLLLYQFHSQNYIVTAFT